MMFVEVFFYLILFISIMFLVSRKTCGITNSRVCLLGKTAIVTGGNAGIGYHIVENLASRGCRVIIADKDDTEKTKNQIIRTTKNPNVIVKYLNLASFESVRKFVEEIYKTEDRLDILINNAGVAVSQEIVSEDGLNAAFQVNHYGPFLLTHLLADLLKRSSPSRIIFTSSAYAFFSTLTPDKMNPTDYEFGNLIRHHEIYADSKLCAIVAAQQFGRRLRSFGVTANAVHPGCVRTGILRWELLREKWWLIGNWIVWELLTHVVGKNAWEGSQTSVHLAIDNGLDMVSGKLFFDCTVSPILPLKLYDDDFCVAVWKKSQQLCGLTDNEISLLSLEN